MKTILLLTQAGELQSAFVEALGQYASVVPLSPPAEQTRAAFDKLFATWRPLADAVILDAVSLGESARWAIESLTSGAAPASVCVRVTPMQRNVYALPSHWLVFTDTDPVEQVDRTLRSTLELREAQTKLQRIESPLPARPLQVPVVAGPTVADSHRYREALKALAGTLGQRPTREALLKEFLRVVRELLGIGRISLFTRRGDELVLTTSVGVRQDLAARVRLTLTEGIGAVLAGSGVILRSSMAEAEALREFGILGTEVAVPMLDDDQLVGVLTAGQKLTGESLANDELELIYHLLGHLALTLRNQQLQEQAAGQELFLRDVLGNLHTGVVIVSADQRIMHVNRLARELLELDETEQVGQAASRLPSRVAAVLFEALQTGQRIPQREVTTARAKRLVGISAARIASAAGDVAVALIEDLSQVKLQQAAARELEERELFTRISYRLSHELKNSLVSIKIFGQLLPERHGDKEFREQFSNVVVNEVNRVDVLVNNLTFFAQPLGLVYEELVLSELIEACLKNLGPEFARKKLAQVIAMGDRSAEEGGPPVVTVKRNFSHKVAKVQGDRIRLMQAIENVMRNAVQAMPNGGRLSINTVDVAATEVPDGKLPAGGLVRVEFVDTGEGIALDDLRRVTEPFVTTRNVGVGLGLTIVKKILDRHSGWLELDSMLGRGTTVRFWLPVTMQPHPEDKLLAQLARSGSVSEFFSGETSDEQQNRLAQVLEDQRRRRPPVSGV